jgi:hypothetical protein
MARYGKGANKYGASPAEYLAYKRYAHLLAYKHYMTELFEPLIEKFSAPYPEYAERVQKILNAIQKTLQATSSKDLSDGGVALDTSLIKIGADIEKLYADLRTSGISLPSSVIADKSKIHDKASNIFDSFVVGKSWRNRGKLKSSEDIFRIIDSEIGFTPEREEFLGKAAKVMAQADMLRTAVSNIQKVSEARIKRRLISREDLQRLQETAQAISRNLQKAYTELENSEVRRGTSRKLDDEVARADSYVEQAEKGLIRLLELSRSTGIMEAHRDDNIRKFVRENIAHKASEIAYDRLYPSAATRPADQKDNIAVDISRALTDLDRLNIEISSIAPATAVEIAAASAAVEAVAPKPRGSIRSAAEDDREVAAASTSRSTGPMRRSINTNILSDEEMTAASAAVEEAARSMTRSDEPITPSAPEPAFMARYGDGARHGAKYKVNDARYLFLKKVAGAQGLADVFNEVKRAMVGKTISPELQGQARLISNNLDKAYDALLRAEQTRGAAVEANASLREVENAMRAFVRKAKDEDLVPHLKSKTIADTAHERARKYFAELVPTAPGRPVSKKENITHDIERFREELRRNSEGIGTRERIDSDDDRFEAHVPLVAVAAAAHLPRRSSAESIAEDAPIPHLHLTADEVHHIEATIVKAHDNAINTLTSRMVERAVQLAEEINIVSSSEDSDLAEKKAGRVGEIIRGHMHERSLIDMFRRSTPVQQAKDRETRSAEAKELVIAHAINEVIETTITNDFAMQNFGRILTKSEKTRIAKSIKPAFKDYVEQIMKDKDKSALVIIRERARVGFNRFFRTIFEAIGFVSKQDLSSNRDYARSHRIKKLGLEESLRSAATEVITPSPEGRGAVLSPIKGKIGL